MALSITLHNILPDHPSDGIHVPFHTIALDPFKRPFTFGPIQCELNRGAHIGMPCEENVAAAFVGSDGQFLVLSSEKFIVFTPTTGLPISLGATLFPKPESHSIEVAQKGKGYPIGVGSSILAYDFDSSPSLRSVTFFMGVNQSMIKDDVYRLSLNALSHSLIYFAKMWQDIAPKPTDAAKPRTVNVDLYKPVASPGEQLSNMKILMFSAPPRNMVNHLSKPAPPTSKPPPLPLISTTHGSIVKEPENHKRQKI